jgi:hypothetical protein
MTQRVRRAERLKRHRGFVYHRPPVNFTSVLKDAYPLGPADWPSAATVTLRVLVGHFPRRRPETLLVRVGRSRSEAEAIRRAVSKLRLSEGEAYRLLGAVRVKPDGVPGIARVLYRDDPFVRLVRAHGDVADD